MCEKIKSEKEMWTPKMLPTASIMDCRLQSISLSFRSDNIPAFALINKAAHGMAKLVSIDTQGKFEKLWKFLESLEGD